MSLLEWDNEGSQVLRERLADCNPAEVVTSIISYEEQMRGWMAYVSKARTTAKQVQAYRRLRTHLDNYRQIPVLDFDDSAAAIYQQLRRTHGRIGAMDLKIAAIAISIDATLASRNLVDFERVPGLKVEDLTE